MPGTSASRSLILSSFVWLAVPWRLPGGEVVKASELSGQDGLLFIGNSTTGVVECRPRKGHGIVLNEALHAN